MIQVHVCMWVESQRRTNVKYCRLSMLVTWDNGNEYKFLFVVGWSLDSEHNCIKFSILLSREWRTSQHKPKQTINERNMFVSLSEIKFVWWQNIKCLSISCPEQNIMNDLLAWFRQFNESQNIDDQIIKYLFGQLPWQQWIRNIIRWTRKMCSDLFVIIKSLSDSGWNFNSSFGHFISDEYDSILLWHDTQNIFSRLKLHFKGFKHYRIQNKIEGNHRRYRRFHRSSSTINFHVTTRCSEIINLLGLI